MWRQYFDRFFPLDISQQQDVLVIEDRRPSDSLMTSVMVASGSLLISAVLFRPLIAYGLYWTVAFFLLPALIFGVRSLFLPFREKYIFDKGQSTYTFTRQSALKRESREGDLSQIRGVQMERRMVLMEGGNIEVFRVALVRGPALLFGVPDTVVLREERPVASRYESEAQVAYAIASFLQVPMPQVVDV